MLLSINSKSPVIEMTFENYEVSLKFMLDTGAGPSLLKIGKKPSKAIVFENEILELKGITKESMYSRGKTPLIFRDITLYFHLVPDDFPIDEDGLVGSEMLSRYKAKINYEENFLEIVIIIQIIVSFVAQAWLSRKIVLSRRREKSTQKLKVKTTKI